MNLLELLKPRENALHIIIDRLFNVIQHGLVYRENKPGFMVQRLKKANKSQLQINVQPKL